MKFEVAKTYRSHKTGNHTVYAYCRTDYYGRKKGGDAKMARFHNGKRSGDELA